MQGTSALSQSPPPFAAFEWLIAWRYLRARRKEGGISVIAWYALIGVMLGVATLIVVPVLLNQDPIWSLGLALVVALFLRSGLNTDELTEQAKEQREQLDTERSKRPN